MSRLQPIFTLLLSLGFCASVWAQNPNVQILTDSISVQVTDEDSYSCYRHREILLNNGKAASWADISIGMQPGMELQSFEYEMCDLLGNRLRPMIRKRDLQMVDYSQHLASDYYRLVMDVTPPCYPVVIKITSRLSCEKNALSYPAFFPQSARSVSVGHAVYRISWPKDRVNLRHKAINMPQLEPQVEGNRAVLTYRLDRVPAVPASAFSPHLEALVPFVLFAPHSIFYYGTKGYMSDWRSLGLWTHSLTEDTHYLTGQVHQEIAPLLDTCHTALDKVKVLYDYMGRQTRYVSIQLGIGGFRPMAAGEVANRGYGDCKGLSNFMRAMLLSAGIESRLVLISTEEARLIPNFANFQQCNHMILEAFLPRQNGVDTLWLECTNPKLPLGYLHPNIAGHDAIEISDQGGRFVTLPEYPDSMHLAHAEVDVDLHGDATAYLKVRSCFEGHRYPEQMGLLTDSDKERRDALKASFQLPGVEIEKISVADSTSLGGVPRLCSLVQAFSPKYANQSGNRLFVSLNPMRPISLYGKDPVVSELPLFIRHGCREEVTVNLSLPDGMSVESLPKEIVLQEEFADFRMQVTDAGGKVYYTLRLDLHAGTYPSAARVRLEAMQKEINRACGAKLVLTKKR